MKKIKVTELVFADNTAANTERYLQFNLKVLSKSLYKVNSIINEKKTKTIKIAKYGRPYNVELNGKRLEQVKKFLNI